jgi:hypothetical protein
MINPAIGPRIRETRLGSVPESALVRQDEKQDRYDRQPPLLIPMTLGPWFRENVGSTGAGNYGMRRLVLVTHSTTAADFGTTGSGVEASMQGSPGKVVAAELFASADVTADGVTLGVMIDNGTPQALGDIALSTVQPRSIVYRLGWSRGIPFASGQTVEPVLIVTGGLAPTTLDMVASLSIMWEEPR